MRDLTIQKARQRAELEQLTSEYLERGGEIRHRNNGHIDTRCGTCGHRERLPMQMVTRLGLRCRRCGSRVRVN